MPLVEGLSRQPWTQESVLDAWFEDRHEQAAHSTTKWTDVPYSPGDPPYILVTPPHGLESTWHIDWLFVKDQVRHRAGGVDSAEKLRNRLDNANNHFRRKAADVLGDEDAVLLLANLYEQSSINLTDFDTCQHGITLARLTAANFCEIGANVIYITEAGQNFIESLDQR